MELIQRLMLTVVVATAVWSASASPAQDRGVVWGVDDEDDRDVLVNKRDDHDDDDDEEKREDEEQANADEDKLKRGTECAKKNCTVKFSLH